MSADPPSSMSEGQAAIHLAHQAEVVVEGVRRLISQRRLPEATYRLQVNRSFTFRDVAEQVSYLAELGITDCYLSPYMKARAGTSHGYDVVDHNALNPEIGTDADFNAMVEKLRSHGMGHILDVVPNHMGIDTGENAWWTDVLENGPASCYASFFDIDWMPLKPDLANKVLLPILGDQYGKVLEDQQLMLALEDGAFFLHYFDRRFPIAVDSWELILKHRLASLDELLGADNPHVIEYRSILTAVGHLPRRSERDPTQLAERRREKDVIKRRLQELCRASPEVRLLLEETVRDFNGRKGEPRSFDLLDQLLLDQSYRLAYWRVAADEINYRRFFDINEMAAICMENPDVFKKSHALILKLIEEDKLLGLRIDHPDGLFDPSEYLARLQKSRFLQLCRVAFESAAGHAADRDGITWESLEPSLAKDFDSIANTDDDLVRPLYVVVEKILEPGERIPENWPVFGTTGYDFLNMVNGLFVNSRNARAFQVLYERFVHHPHDYADEVYRCKRLILTTAMSSEVNVLGHQLDRISERNRRSRDFTLNSLTAALREVIAAFPIYRTYVTRAGVLDRDRRYIEQAISWAKRRNRSISHSVFDFVREVLLLEDLDAPDQESKEAQLAFVCKFQQVTGPVMAKAVEDTAFYRYNRLVSLNEVGGDPELFGTTVEAFHRQNVQRQERWPRSMLASSTHDTKRSEDVRARINVLSEIPREFRTRLFRWARWNRASKTDVDEEPAPSRGDEFLLYQVLLGTWPFQAPEGQSRDEYVQRIEQYAVKAAREAKIKTSWVSPNEAYERALKDFIEAVLRPSKRRPFLADFQALAERIADSGIFNSLAQTVLKFTSPGSADLYQGSELWDFSLVDPDNRRPVDYRRRREELLALQSRLKEGSAADLCLELLARRTDGRIKLYTTWRLLQLRKELPRLFAEGAYLPLEPLGAKRDHVCAFARKSDCAKVVVVVPRLVVGLNGETGRAPVGPEVWGDTDVPLSPFLGSHFQNAFTGEIVASVARLERPEEPRRLLLREVLTTFPVAVLRALN